jgi:hypothetical protein
MRDGRLIVRLVAGTGVWRPEGDAGPSAKPSIDRRPG